MKLLWIGIDFNKEIEEELWLYKAKILSGAVSQKSLISGIDNHGFTDMDTINSYRYPCFPKGPRRVVRREWSRTGTSKDVSVSYFNFKYISHFFRKKALKKEIRKWAENIPQEEEIVAFVYSMHSPFLEAAKELKRVHKKTRVALIVLDLPQFMDMGMSSLKKFLKAIDWKNICKLLKCVDKYILYSKHMAEYLHLKDGAWMVMEGSYDPSLLIDDSEVQKNGKKISIMYSGVLDLRYGIRELLDAMNLLDDRYELWLTGTGNAVPLIKERAEKDNRIQYYGFLPSRRDLLKKQHEATMLISTRDPSEEASVYCFPSKIFEYMVSGNPVLSTKIKGIPDEYFAYLVGLETITPENIANSIQTIADMDPAERGKLGNAGKDFVLKEKNNLSQTRKMLDFVGGV